MTETPARSEDPEGALLRTQQILFGPVPPEGSRTEALVDLAYRAAEAGQSNDWILNALAVACDLWGKHPRTFDRWSRLLNLLRMARKVYPNGVDGEGWRPGGNPPEALRTDVDQAVP
jgi:hypothetical protein